MYSGSVAVAELVDGDCLAAKVRRVNRVLVRLYDDALREHGLTVAQLDLLATLLQRGRTARPVDLARWLLMDRSTVTRNVARLAQQGLVVSGPGASGRESEVSVTADGEAAARRAFAAWNKAQERAVGLLGGRGVRALDVLVERVNLVEGGG